MNRMIGGTLGVAVIGAVFQGDGSLEARLSSLGGLGPDRGAAQRDRHRARRWSVSTRPAAASSHAQAAADRRSASHDAFVSAFASSMKVATAVAPRGRGRRGDPDPLPARGRERRRRPRPARDAGGRARHRRAAASSSATWADASAGQRSGSDEVDRHGSVSTLTSPSRSIVSRFDASTVGGSVGPRREHDRGDLEPDRPRRLDRQQGVVDRPQAGRGGDHHRQPQLPGEVAHQVAERQRDQQAADALADQDVGASPRRPRRRASSAPGSIRSPASSAAEVRRDRRAVAVGRDLLVGLRRPGGAAEQRVVGLARSPPVVQAADRRLEDRDPLAGCGERPRDRRGDDGLARPRSRCR